MQHLLVIRGSPVAGEGTGGRLLDDLDGDPVHVSDPVGQPNLATGSSPQDPAHRELGGELWRESLLNLLAAEEDKHLLGRVTEADISVGSHREGFPLADLVAVNIGS